MSAMFSSAREPLTVYNKYKQLLSPLSLALSLMHANHLGRISYCNTWHMRYKEYYSVQII